MPTPSSWSGPTCWGWLSCIRSAAASVRSSRVAHAFLFHPDEAVLTEEAVARLSTLADYTELGSGFKIAMRDLEIRGAGELLGEEQSGHIAAVGFEMYLSMLQRGGRPLEGRRGQSRKGT